MPSCIVSGCIHKTTKKNCNEEGVIMHAFPSSLSRIKLWLRSIERNNHQYFGDIDALAENIFYKKNNSSSRICSDHFDSECYVPAHSKRRALRQDAVPTLFRAPLALTAIHDATPPQHIPFMVDAITQTDPYTYTQDKGVQWPEFEFNVGGQSWKIEHDHVYHTGRSTAKTSNRVVNANASVNTSDNSMLNGLERQQSTRPKEPVVMNCSVPNREHMSDSSGYSDRDSCIGQETADKNCVKERKFIVFESCLDVLFRKVRCKIEDCNALVTHTQKHVLGSYLSVTGQCLKGHTFHIWHSQPTRGEVALGNVLSSAALLFSGSDFHKVQELCHLLGLQFISHHLYDLYQHKYLFPTVNLHWQQERLRLNKASLGTRLCLAGSGQCNTYENGYRYGIYTFLDTATKRIVDFETIQGTKANSFVALKRKAFVRCLNRILRDRFEVASVSTDYHPKLKKTCEQQYRIQHEYDAWLYTKGIEKRLLAACRKENCSVIAEWIPSIKKHLWWCLGASNGDAKVLCELWQSVLMHVTDRHKWDHGELYHACAHRPLTEFERHCRPWVKENSEPYHALYDVVMNPKVLKDLHHLSRFLHTGEIDVYHHFLSKYRRKRVYLKLNALEARIKLAALAHNANVHRKRVNFHSIWHGKAAIGTRRHDGISRKKKYNSKTLSGSSNSHVLPMMTDVLKFFDCRLTNDCSLWTSALKDITEQTLNKRSY
ncbi:uncharacterized protein LOC130310103 isoform X1 [Hyla sarda]|uniref:uncharacterized protein LOC130310103 isoform X1 n=1 Tax=Hyla sarda TaxID=327740 RepID=UPI0024C2D01E|nr:uncharacterized protein LOC130310103 isoform X1 [Hyla sarda]